MCLTGYGYVHVSVESVKVRGEYWFIWTGVTGGAELLDVGAVNRTQFCHKSNPCCKPLVVVSLTASRTN